MTTQEIESQRTITTLRAVAEVESSGSAEHLSIGYPVFFSAPYAQELEMRYFLVEPLFDRAEVFKAQRASDAGIANIIERMIR